MIFALSEAYVRGCRVFLIFSRLIFLKVSGVTTDTLHLLVVQEVDHHTLVWFTGTTKLHFCGQHVVTHFYEVPRKTGSDMCVLFGYCLYFEVIATVQLVSKVQCF